jgi:pimeloyl-ACP methyl ester carboxylesterase
MSSTPRPRLAFHLTPGDGPAVLFLPGYASDMTGTKALALEAWARNAGRAFCRFDYAGCGESEGAFAEQSFADWLGDALAMTDGPLAGRDLVLVGSSLGGWIMLHAALARPGRVVGLVGIAAAPDLTDWGFSMEEKLYLLEHGRLERANPHGPAPTPYTSRFWQSGEAHRVMGGPIAINAPVRLVHGLADAEVPWVRSARLAELVRSADAQAWLVKGGDHRLSRADDVALIVRAVEDVSRR